MTAATHQPITRTEVVRVLLVGVTAAVLYLLLVQDRMPGDAAGLVANMARAVEGEGPATFWYHLLYAWSARGIEQLTGFLSVRSQLELLSALAGGAVVPLAYLALRRLELGRLAAGGATALLVLSPAMTTHATIIEVHGFQLATGLVGLACVARAAHQGLAMLALTGLFAGLVVSLGHQTGPLLFPGLVLASFWTPGAGSAAARATGLAARAARFCASSAGFLVAIFVSRELTARFSPFANIRAFSDFAGLTAMLTKGTDWPFLRDELFAGLALLLAVAALGAIGGLGALWRARGGSSQGPAAGAPQPAATRDLRVLLGLVLVAVPFGFFLVFGERTEGGYFLGASPGLLLLAALFLERRGSALFVGALVLVGLGTSVQSYTNPETRLVNRRAAARAVEVRELLPSGGTLYSLQYNEHTLAGSFDDLIEVSDCGILRAYVEERFVPIGFALRLSEKLARLQSRHPPVVVDWTWSARSLHYDRKTWRPYLDAIRAQLDEGWQVTEHHGTWGTLLELQPR
ncbi:MAG: hypothetical protein P1V81_06955 [Planctomycetota bacterium]|nr:hypothetical protein [Planctomycetota bacterium]